MSRVSLIAEIDLPRDVHVYAPEVKGYKPIQLGVTPMTDFQLMPAVYPNAHTLYLPAIKEKVPVFEGKFRIVQDVEIVTSREFAMGLPADGKNVTVTGELKYQACDKKVCYTPTSVPVQWNLQIMPLDLQAISRRRSSTSRRKKQPADMHASCLKCAIYLMFHGRFEYFSYNSLCLLSVEVRLPFINR